MAVKVGGIAWIKGPLYQLPESGISAEIRRHAEELAPIAPDVILAHGAGLWGST